jgi:anti-sigma regulatory factor (Ser/Thr protein kinase)
MSVACLEVIVSDDGPGFASSTIPLGHPPPQSVRGYGLFMMQRLVDIIEFRDHGRTVWFLKRFRVMET